MSERPSSTKNRQKEVQVLTHSNSNPLRQSSQSHKKGDVIEGFLKDLQNQPYLGTS